MIEFSCPIRDMAVKAGLPGCKVECGVFSGSDPSCPYTNNDILFPVTDNSKTTYEVKVRPADILTLIGNEGLTIFDKIGDSVVKDG